MNPFEKLLSTTKVKTVDPVAALVEGLSTLSGTRSLTEPNIGKLSIATESLNDDNRTLLDNTANNMKALIENVLQDFSGSISLEAFQVEAGVIGGMLATNPRAILSSELKDISQSSSVIAPSVTDASMSRFIATEAYDERENRNAQVYTIMFNLLASRQDEFGETFFPTIVINPTEVGVMISMKLFYVFNDFKRSVKGALADYGRMNILRAYADHTVLQNELTKCIPVFRSGGGDDDNQISFVSEVPSFTEAVSSSVTVTSGYLKTGIKVDLLGLSQTNELLNSGLMGPSDTLDAAIKLKEVVLKAGADVFVLDVSSLPGSNFHYSVQGNSRRMVLDLDTDSLVLNKGLKTAAGAAPAVLTPLTAHDARVQLNITGSVILDKGTTTIQPGTVSLVTLRNTAGALVTDSNFTTLANALDTAEIIGYRLSVYRANSNIRQRGQLVDSQEEFRTLQVPYRSPIAVIAPVMGVNGEDTTALQTLITYVGIRTSNEAVTTLLNVNDRLASYNAVPNANGELPAMSDIGFNYVRPVYFSPTIDLSLTVDGLKSHERLADIRAALVEQIRYYATEMYRSSEYKAAADALTGNIGYKPTVIVGTDQVIYNYIQADGELTALGDKFDVKVVSTMDRRVKGKIFVTFGVFDGSRNTAINPLNFGNMLYSGEIPFNMAVSRDGQVSKELVVTPRFLHVANLPILTTMTVQGLPTIIGKATQYMTEPPTP